MIRLKDFLAIVESQLDDSGPNLGRFEKAAHVVEARLVVAKDDKSWTFECHNGVIKVTPGSEDTIDPNAELSMESL